MMIWYLWYDMIWYLIKGQGLGLFLVSLYHLFVHKHESWPCCIFLRSLAISCWFCIMEFNTQPVYRPALLRLTGSNTLVEIAATLQNKREALRFTTRATGNKIKLDEGAELVPCRPGSVGTPSPTRPAGSETHRPAAACRWSSGTPGTSWTLSGGGATRNCYTFKSDSNKIKLTVTLWPRNVMRFSKGIPNTPKINIYFKIQFEKFWPKIYLNGF